MGWVRRTGADAGQGSVQVLGGPAGGCGLGGELLRLAQFGARIEVTDDGPATGDPSPRNGWGLAIVASVTDRAAATTQLDGRRTAWCEVTWPA